MIVTLNGVFSSPTFTTMMSPSYLNICCSGYYKEVWYFFIIALNEWRGPETLETNSFLYFSGKKDQLSGTLYPMGSAVVLNGAGKKTSTF